MTLTMVMKQRLSMFHTALERYATLMFYLYVYRNHPVRSFFRWVFLIAQLLLNR